MARFPRIRRLRDVITGEVYYEDLKMGKIQYRRLVGGLAWPYGVEKPGCVVLLAEGRVFKEETQNHWIWLVGEYVNHSSQELLRVLGQMDESVYGVEWVTDLKNPHYLLVEQWNDERADYRQKTIVFYNPPEIHKPSRQLFRFYDQLVDKRTRTQKSLFFGKDSEVARQYAILTPDDFRKSMEEFPCVCAFLYTLATLEFSSKQQEFNSYYQVPDEIGGY